MSKPPSKNSPSVRQNKRLRVFAGPNGSGKSTIIQALRNIKVNGYPIDFGIYINADDIAKSLREGTFTFKKYQLGKITRSTFIDHALASGLINRNFPEASFTNIFTLNNAGVFKLVDSAWDEHMAQLMADFLRCSLLREEKKISFETVFSHPSKLDFMKKANDQGYKIYLYFISTESPLINISRIKEVRTKRGGHDVPEEKIVSRYKRSMELLYDAAELAYQAYFFDNSHEDSGHEPFAHFKVNQSEKKWDEELKEMDPDSLPEWFWKYYLSKLSK